MKRSTLPPRQVRHGPPAELITPLDARTPSSASRATASTRLPAFSPLASPNCGRASDEGASTRKIARSVSASRPASVASTFVPSGSVTLISSSRRTAWSAVTMMFGRQSTPLEPSRWRAWTSTVDAPARSTALARSLESAVSAVDGSVMVGIVMMLSPRAASGRNEGSADSGSSMTPDGAFIYQK